MQDHIQHAKKGSVPRISSEKKCVILLMIILSVLKYKAVTEIRFFPENKVFISAHFKLIVISGCV